MTYIQPKKNFILLNIVIAGLILFLGADLIVLIMLESHIVNLEHGASEMKADTQTLEAQNATMRNDLFAMFDGTHVSAYAEDYALSEDKSPEYFNLGSQWSFASHF